MPAHHHNRDFSAYRGPESGERVIREFLIFTVAILIVGDRHTSDLFRFRICCLGTPILYSLQASFNCIHFDHQVHNAEQYNE